MEKRQYVRLPLDLEASITVNGGRPQACQIKDFSLGGVFLSCKGLKAGKSAGSKPSALEQQPVEIAFSAKFGGREKKFRVTGRIARVSKSQVAVEFVNADPATLLVMQEIANKAQKEFLDTREMEAVRRKAAGDQAADGVENRIGIVELLKEMVARFLKEGLEALFVDAREQLFGVAKKAANPVQETECMDALKELENIRSLVEKSFLETVMGHVVKPGNTQLAGPESPKQTGGELTLVDPEKFQDWLRMKRILEKAGPKHKDNQYELHARLSAVSDTEIDEFNNPIGLVEICSSFYDSVQELGASRIAREAVFDALESAVVSKLGMLYAEVNEMLVGKGILPTVEPPKHVIKKNPRAEAPKSAHPSASPGTHQAPPDAGAAGSGASHVGGATAHGGAPPAHGQSAGGHSGGGHATYSGGGSSAPPAQGPSTGGHSGGGGHAAYSGGGSSAPPAVASGGSAAPAYPSPNAPTAPSSGAQPATAPAQAPAGSAQAASSAAAAVDSAGSGASPADTSAMHVVPGSRSSAPGHRQGAIPASGQRTQPGASAYQAVHSLLGLQRQVHGSGTQSGSGAQGGSAPGAGGGGGGGASGPAYARNEIINALSSVQHQSAGDGGLPGGANLKQRIQSALEQQQPAGSSKQLGETEDAAIDLTTGLVESIVEDVLVSDEIRSQFNRLEIPLIKAAMKNDNFFADSRHPARRVVDQLGALTIPEGKTGAKLREIVNQVVNQIATGEGDGESEFASAAGQLDAVLNEQMAAYEQNVRRVVEACEHQEEITQTRRKGGAAGHDAHQDVPEELRQWLERARRLQVGDRVAIDKGGRTHQETLAWVSSDQDKYVFVDGVGEKASSMIRQQLAMLLKRGLLRVLAESAVPAMERGMHEIMRKMHEDLAQKATQDPTTGLINQKAFLDRVNRTITEATQNSSEHVLCYLDLDHFGEINKKWGETAGDRLLRRFGIVLKKNMGEKGITARLPEDEFGLVLHQCSQSDGHEFADRLRRAIASARCYWKGESLPLSVSIGLVPITDRSESVSALMEAAKAACMKAKQAGRDRVEVFQPKQDKANARSIDHDKLLVDKILEGDRLELQAQRVEPIGEDADGKPHYEILLGIRDIRGNLASPEPLMRAAERSKQVTQVDRWVIRKALEWMAKNKRRLLKLGGFAINLSGLSLNDETLTEYVMDQFMKTKVPPGKVVFEVTETAAIERLSAAEEFLRVMKDFGCRFALDDFGTGNSSYDYLQQLAVDFVKVDGMFVKELETSASDYAMVKSIAEIGRYTGKKTIAEDVENEAILNKLKEIGVDYVQGSLVEKPMLLQELR